MKIICIGRNYALHAAEMNAERPVEPVFFLKPDTAVLNGTEFYYPEFTNELHHEVEVVVKIAKAGKHIASEFAKNYYNEIGLGIDFTARDIQAICKQKGLPWEKAKAFDQAAVIGNHFLSKSEFSDLKSIRFRLDINGKTVQNGDSGLMIFDFDEIISHVSRYITLKIGDLIYTGTPAGVGTVSAGDLLEGYLEEAKLFDFTVK